MATRNNVVAVASYVWVCSVALAATAGPARAAVYVVDQAAPGAADTNTGLEDKPFKTVQHAADVARPGDTICVMAGRYDERIKVKANGAEGQPITFQAMPRRSAIVKRFDLALHRRGHRRVDEPAAAASDRVPADREPEVVAVHAAGDGSPA